MPNQRVVVVLEFGRFPSSRHRRARLHCNPMNLLYVPLGLIIMDIV